MPHKIIDGETTLNVFFALSVRNNFPKEMFENSGILTSKKVFFKEHRSNVDVDLDVPLISIRSCVGLKKETGIVNEPAVTIMGLEKVGNFPVMVKLSPISQSTSFLINSTNLGCSIQRMLSKVSNIETVPNTKFACKTAMEFADMQVMSQENVVALN